MPSANGTFARLANPRVVGLLAAAAVFLLGPASSVARAADPGALRKQISAGENRVSALTGTIGAENSRLRQLDSSIAGLQNEIARIEANLAAKRAELARLRRELRIARLTLARLKAFERKAEYVLSKQLVALYENDPPDIVTVVLDSNGFTNLLERLSFARRIRNQDQQIVATVMRARDRVAAQAVRLGVLEGRQEDLAAQVLSERDRVYAAKVTLVKEQISVTRRRDGEIDQRAVARDHLSSLRRQLARLQAEQAAALAAQQAAAARAASAAAIQPAPSGSSGAGTDNTGSRAGPDPIPGFSIGRDDMGVDATAPTGAGIYAPLASTLVQVLQDWYAGQPLLLFRFDNPPPGAPSASWYVAEEIDPVTTAIGTGFGAGQRVASFAPSGTGIEIGWGSATSDSRTLAGATDPAAASPPAGSATSWGESFKAFFGIS
jgi:peptidoglycan hydrolase CwlO-like protein